MSGEVGRSTRVDSWDAEDVGDHDARSAAKGVVVKRPNHGCGRVVTVGWHGAPYPES